MELFDSHVHYEDAMFKDDRYERLDRLRNTDVQFILNCCSDVEVFDTVIDIVDKYDFAYGSIGIHPHWTAETPDDYLDRIKELVKHPKIVAIGEMGLDYFWSEPKDLQKRIFSLLGLSDEEAHEKFGFLTDAFKYGAPPHGGIGLGLDRLVMQMLKLETLRDCIAYPKVQNASEPMTECPAFVDAEQLEVLGIAHISEEE